MGGGLTPFAGPDALQRVVDVGGKAEGWENLLYLPADQALANYSQPLAITILEIGDEGVEDWAGVSRRVFFGNEPNEVGETLGLVFRNATNIRRYAAYWEGELAATATMTPGGGITFLGGGATLEEFRGRGLEAALIHRRLADAREHSDLITMGATPGSASHRNAERIGFRVGFSQLSLRVPVGRLSSP